MALDRALREEELVGDLGVGQALRDVGENLALAVGEGGSLDAGPHCAGDDRLPGADGADRHRQGRLEQRLEDDRVGAGVEGAAHPGRGRGRRDGDDRRSGHLAAQTAQGRHLTRQVHVADEDRRSPSAVRLQLGDFAGGVGEEQCDIGERALEGRRDAALSGRRVGGRDHAEWAGGHPGALYRLAQYRHGSPTGQGSESLRDPPFAEVPSAGAVDAGMSQGSPSSPCNEAPHRLLDDVSLRRGRRRLLVHQSLRLCDRRTDADRHLRRDPARRHDRVRLQDPEPHLHL